MRAKVVRKRVCAKRAQMGRAKASRTSANKSARNRFRAKGRALEVAGCTTSRRSVPSASLSFLSLSSLSHTLSFLELRRLAEHAQSGLAGSPQAHAHCQLGVELHAPRPLVVKPAQHDARTMVVLVVGIRYTGSDHWPIPSATTWSYGPVHRVHDARHQMAFAATPNLPVLPTRQRQNWRMFPVGRLTGSRGLKRCCSRYRSDSHTPPHILLLSGGLGAQMVLQVPCREGTSWRLVAHCPIHRCGRSKSTTASSQPTILLAHGRTSNSRLDIHSRRLPPTPATAKWFLHVYPPPAPHRQNAVQHHAVLLPPPTRSTAPSHPRLSVTKSEVLLVTPIRSARVVIHQGVPRCRRPRHNRRGSRERSHKRSVSPLVTTINHCLDGG